MSEIYLNPLGNPAVFCCISVCVFILIYCFSLLGKVFSQTPILKNCWVIIAGISPLQLQCPICPPQIFSPLHWPICHTKMICMTDNLNDRRGTCPRQVPHVCCSTRRSNRPVTPNAREMLHEPKRLWPEHRPSSGRSAQYCVLVFA